MRQVGECGAGTQRFAGGRSRMVADDHGSEQICVLLHRGCLALSAGDARCNRHGCDPGGAYKDELDARILTTLGPSESRRERFRRARLHGWKLPDDHERRVREADDGEGQIRHGVEEATKRAVESERRHLQCRHAASAARPGAHGEGETGSCKINREETCTEKTIGREQQIRNELKSKIPRTKIPRFQRRNVGTRSQDAWTGAALKAAALRLPMEPRAALKAAALRLQESPGAAEKRRALGYNPWNLVPR